MKKLFLSLAVVMSVSLFACSGADKTQDSIDSAKAAESAAAAAQTVVEEVEVAEVAVADSPVVANN